MTYDIPGQEQLEIKTIILDLNGTLSVAGTVPEGVKERLDQLKAKGFKVVFFTGNTRNDADDLATSLDIEWKLAKDAAGKRDLALELEPETCASIGNGKGLPVNMSHSDFSNWSGGDAVVANRHFYDGVFPCQGYMIGAGGGIGLTDSAENSAPA